MQRVVILTGGEFVDYPQCQAVKQAADYLICADKGVEYAQQLGWQPDLIIGDFDSVPAAVLNVYKEKGYPIRTYPPQKDYTDTHLAVDAALALGATEIIILGGTGSRFDHTFANFCLLLRIARQGVVGKIIDPRHEISVVIDTLILQGKCGDIVSLLPLTAKVAGVSLQGFQYPLDNATLELDNPIGISNVMLTDRAVIKITDGALLVIKINERI